MNASKATRQLLRHLAFRLHNFVLSEIELKLVVGLNFTITRWSYVVHKLELNAGQTVKSSRFETNGKMSRRLRRPTATQSLR